MSKFKFQILNLLIVCCIASSTNTFDIVQLTQDPFHEYASLTTSNTINSNAQVIKVKQGSKVKLECSFDYYYSPPQSQQQIGDTNEFSSTDGIENSNIYKMLWLKENKGVIAINNEVKYNKEKYSIETTSTNTLNLIIDHVDTSDNGKYICQHFDFSNLKLYLIIVLVPPQPPQISYTINNQSTIQHAENRNLINLYENDFIKLTCLTKYAGNPAVVYKWYRNGEEVPSQLLSSTAPSTPNNVLNLKNVDHVYHLEQFTCAINNEALDEPLKITVQFNVYFKPYVNIYFNSSQNIFQSNLTHHLISYKTYENASEIILCSVKANPKPVRIEWYKDNVYLDNISDYSYEISRININHDGLYRCRVYNSLGFGQYEVELDVQYKPILNIESIVEAHEGHNVDIVCEIDSNPVHSSIAWYFNSEKVVLPSSDSLSNLAVHSRSLTKSAHQFLPSDMSFTIENNKTILRISPVRSSYHNAIIKCVVGNNIYMPDLGRYEQFTSEINTHLNVLYKPIVETYTTSKIAVELNNTADLRCIIRSNPFSTFYWVYNETVIENPYDYGQNELISISNDILSNENRTQISILTLSSVQHKQFGWYRCYANNTIGYVMHEIYLMLATKPDVPINLAILNKTFSNVLLQWKPEFDGGSEQTFVISINDTQEIVTNKNPYLITNLKDSTFYLFKVKAVNKYGHSAWSKPIDSITNSYLYSSNDIRLKIGKVEKIRDDLRVLFNENILKNATYVPSKLKYLIKFSSLESFSTEYFNITHNQTHFTLPFNIYSNTTNKLNASICLDFNKAICSEAFSVDFDELKKQEFEKADTGNQLTNIIPIEILSIFSKRFNILMVIAGSVLTALLIAVSSGYLIYRIAFYKKPNDDNTNGDQSNDGDKNKMKSKNSMDINATSPISAYSDQDGISSFQFTSVETLDAYSLNATNNTFNASKIVPIPELNEEAAKDDDNNSKQQQWQHTTNQTTDFNNNKNPFLSDLNNEITNNNNNEINTNSIDNSAALQENPIYNHLSTNKYNKKLVSNKLLKCKNLNNAIKKSSKQ